MCLWTGCSCFLTQATLSRFHSSLCRFSCRLIRTCSLSAILWTTPSTFGSSSITRWRHMAVLLHNTHDNTGPIHHLGVSKLRRGMSPPMDFFIQALNHLSMTYTSNHRLDGLFKKISDLWLFTLNISMPLIKCKFQLTLSHHITVVNVHTFSPILPD